ncbi:hypothetical protein K491DRAFT_695497 [Lophiostoma macrostomum CBS 122681]|uniref:Uncharacterized protein n=1 Tax=Lophiostoma macrostomum CBS 122681 TaxID=1314788 RepID=A0A6A6T047_9PLEO|nr:hypothetical protein K491DRAFT_695497 [Lophiostoma macrostomum CBS 122681]
MASPATTPTKKPVKGSATASPSTAGSPRVSSSAADATGSPLRRRSGPPSSPNASETGVFEELAGRIGIRAPQGDGGLYLPEDPHGFGHPQEKDTVEDEIKRFLSPYPSQYPEDGRIVKLDINWAIGRLGPLHFEYADDNFDNRRVLRTDSEVRTRGLELGIPKELMDWLNGQPPTEAFEIAAEKIPLPSQ